MQPNHLLLTQVPVDIRLPAVGRDAVEGPKLADASGSSSDEEEDTDMADAQVRPCAPDAW